MPVLINKASQLAEDLPQQMADESLSQGSHALPMNDPEGNPVVADSLEHAHELISQGYSQPSTGQLQNLLEYAKYSTPEQQLKTAAEGAAESASFGFSTPIEEALGVNPEDITKRRMINPKSHFAGEVGGLLASSATGLGAAPLLERAGAAAAGQVIKGLGEGALAKVGSMAAKNAVETALITSGDEVSKWFANDPQATAENAISHIGLNGFLAGAVLGAGFGAVSPAWEMASKTPVGRFLNIIRNKADGLPKDTLPSPDIAGAAEAAGINLSPEMNAALSENPEARAMFQTLQESNSKAGKEAQASLEAFKTKATDAIVKTLGRTPEEIPALESLSAFDQGSNLQKQLVENIQNKVSPLTEKFEAIKDRFREAPILEEEKASLGNAVGEMAQNQGYGLLEGTAQGNLITKVSNSIPKIQNLEELRKLQSQIAEQTNSAEMWGLGKQLKGIFRNAEESIVENRLGAEAPELLGAHQEARASYRELMDQIDTLNDRLHVGKYAGPGSFLQNLKEMNPETLLNRLLPKNDVGFLDLMQKNFPEMAETLKQNYMNAVLKPALAKGTPTQVIHPKTFFKQLSSWSPELRQFVLGENKESILKGIEGLFEQLPAKMNTSGTARTLDALWDKMPGGVFGAVSALTGHNPIVGYMMGQLGKYVATEIPAAMKLSMLKFLGSELPTNSKAFKVMADFITATHKAEQMKLNAVKNLFKPGAQVLPQAFESKSKDRDNLKKHLEAMNSNPEALVNVGGDTHYYLPEQAQALGEIAGNAVTYLKSIRPETSPSTPFEKPFELSPLEERAYNRQLDIAQQPLTILKHIQKGTLIPQDLVTLQKIYPKLYTDLSQKMINHITSHQLDKNQHIPYSTKMSLSLFLGMPMDSTLSSQSIQSSQSAINPMTQAQTPSQAMPRKSTQSGMKQLNHLVGLNASGAQAREYNRSHMRLSS